VRGVWRPGGVHTSGMRLQPNLRDAPAHHSPGCAYSPISGMHLQPNLQGGSGVKETGGVKLSNFRCMGQVPHSAVKRRRQIQLVAHVPGEPKTCDVSDKIAHYLDRGFDTDAQALEIRFMPDQTPGLTIAPFSIGYILGSSRSMAAVLLLEALMSVGLTADNFQEVGPAGKTLQQCLATMRRVRITYIPAADTTDLVIRTAECLVLGYLRLQIGELVTLGLTHTKNPHTWSLQSRGLVQASRQ
jgi:hypothetical protein